MLHMTHRPDAIQAELDGYLVTWDLNGSGMQSGDLGVLKSTWELPEMICNL